MITLDMTGMTDAQKVEALTAELNKVLDDGAKQLVKYKALYESFEIVKEQCKELQEEIDRLTTRLSEKEQVIKYLEKDG